MRRSVALALFLVLLASVSQAAALSSSDLTAERAAIYDPSSDEFLYSQMGSPAEAAMGSTAKIMTMYVALNAVANGDVALFDKITISDKAATQGCNCFNDVDGTLEGGDQMFLRDALYSVAISDGEPTVAVAEHVAQAVIDGVVDPTLTDEEAAEWEQDFIGLMNEAVDSMGLTHTHFMTPHGGDADGQYTTVEDLARIWNVGVEVHDKWLDFLGWWDRDLLVFHDGSAFGTPYHASLSHGYYPGVEGSKGGNSIECQDCWVASANRLGRRLIVTNMQSDDNKADAKTQFAAGFAQVFEPKQVGGVANVASIVDHALDCSGNDVISAARDAGNQMLLNRWTANADAGTMSKVGGLLTPFTANNTDVDRVNATFVTTVEQRPMGAGVPDRIYLRSWRWAGATPTLVDSETVGDGSLAHVVRLTNDRVLTARATATGYTLRTYAIDNSGILTPLLSSLRTGVVTELDVDSDLTGLQAFVVVRDSAKRLVGHGYTIDALTGAITFMDEEIRGRASKIRVAYISTGWLGELVHDTEAFGSQWTTSYVRDDGKVGVAFWHFGNATVLKHVATWSDAGEAATDSAVTAIHGTGAVTAYRASSDLGMHVGVADYDWEHPGAATSPYYKVANTSAAAGKSSETEICSVNTATSAGAQVTAVKSSSNKLTLQLWRVGDKP
jgi:D-alanyl-D-alanine carboxypeptidase